MNPYRTLGISRDATDAIIRQAYLTAIKACPPERDAARFRKLTAAYESIKDIDSRLGHIVSPAESESSSPLEVAANYALQKSLVPADISTMKRFLRSLA